MKQRRFARTANSLAFRGGLSIAIMVFTLIVVLGATNLYSFRLLAGSLRSGMKSSSEMYAAEIESDLESVSSGVIELVSIAADMQGYYSSTELPQYLTRIQILDKLKTRISFVGEASLFYFYYKDTDQLLMATNTMMPAGSAYTWENRLHQPPADEPARTWNAVLSDGEYWLSQYYDVHQIRVGTAVRMSTLFQSISRNTSIAQRTDYAFVAPEGTVLYTSNPAYLAAGDIVEPGGDTLRAGGETLLTESCLLPATGTLLFYIPASSVLAALTPTFWLVLLFSTAAIILVIILILNTNHRVTVPIKQLSEAVYQMEQGNWEYRLEQHSPILDFQHLFAGFNHMISEVHNLRISAYETELERHRNELRYLQLQIRPHFYLNAITTISSLLYQDRKQNAQAFIDALSNYLRYLFSGANTQVSIGEETEHSLNFIQLQQIRCPDKIFCMAELEPEVREVLIPKFMIQTLVENIFKHGFSPQNFLSIFIEAKMQRHGEEYGVAISVEDNGYGFPPKVLQHFPEPESPKHVGLSNLHHTLKMIYGERATIQLFNVEPTGARVEIYLPQDEGEKPYARTDR